MLVSQCDKEVLKQSPPGEAAPSSGGRQVLCILHLEHGKCYTEYLQAMATNMLDH